MSDSEYFNHRPSEWKPLLQEVIDNGFREECFVWPGGVSKKGTQYPVRDENGEGRWPSHLVLEAVDGPRPGKDHVMRYDRKICATGHPCIRPGHFSWVKQGDSSSEDVDRKIVEAMTRATVMEVHRAFKPSLMRYRQWSAGLSALEAEGSISIVRRGPGSQVWYTLLDES